MAFTTHISPLSQVTVPLADGGDEDILVVRVSHGGVKCKAVNTLVAFLLIPLIVLPIKPDSMEKRTDFSEEDSDLAEV